ncbi:uncharacterized protein LOC114967873 [Acropora millepora]|uniref:uncharacterized protein LOC114967873 n=1 Tax=Acropora millepora TaxID=45264 RepID=UPI001CF32DD5|nr:uncharacterized protein LOC114967873 [Acropora millepora]
MASSASGETIEEPTVKHEQVEVAKHPFCEPWEDSDLIFVVEEEKFHVHRQIMSIHSPVFKAMLNSVGFKEVTATEIPLPGKKANEFLDFLELLYMKKIDEVQLNQVEHLLKLADEYQAGGIEDVCVKMLKCEPKSKDNAVKILYLATSTATAKDDQKLFQVREECYELIKDMELTEAQRSESYNDMEKNTLTRVLMKRNERLETFVKDIYPQFMGLVECCLYYYFEEHSEISLCPQHFSNGKTRENLLRRMKNCSVCRRMIKQMVLNLKVSQAQLSGGRFADKSSVATHSFEYGGDYYFDEKVIAMILDFEKIIRVWKKT